MSGRKATIVASRWFHDADGKFVVFQTPNLSLGVWFVALLIARFAGGVAGDVAALISFGAIFTWSWLEIFNGVNYFRRMLGAVVMILILAGRA